MTMDGWAWELPDELQQLRKVVRDFMRHEVRPAEEPLDFDAYELPHDVLEDLQKKARAAGLWCVASPVEHGGSGMSLLAQCVVAEQASQCRMGAYTPAAGTFGWDPPNVIWKGTPEQIERYAVPTVASGGKTFVAITEPSGGADPARAITTNAVQDGDEWVINGTKVFISAADSSDWGIVFARTSPGKGRQGISCFVVERGTPGLTMRPIPVIRSWYPCELSFVDCRVPNDNLLGEEGRGFDLAQEWLVHGRVPYAAATLGIASAALDIAIEHAVNRETFGSRLADKQAIQWMLADSEIEIRAARGLVYEAAWRADLGREFKVEASAAKVYATETAGRVVDRCIQILGGLGVTKELPLERWYRELRIKRIGEGPSEVHRMVVARELIRSEAAGRDR
ncbi:MAG: acyl-CoA dehydrogenase family protein [Actinomycetota bacterium]|jgi:acyl-CoA dehydrogenase|nr:acyl-CoA dehydrogenase family protein [Actinomycetota bacterium]MDA8269517.1 acyl-CoA dehydrogenase family protein [Actinomycetota bacterium]